MLVKLCAAAAATSLAATAPTCTGRASADAPQQAPTADQETKVMPDTTPTATSEASVKQTSGALDYADKTGAPDPDSDLEYPAGTERAQVVLAGGCFWCVEAVYEQLTGILDAESGYAGGTAETANYKDVSTGATKHAEVVKLVFDPRKLSYGQILKVFFTVAHDPTQKNRQGPDVGPQYRSAVFYASDAEKQVAEAYIKKLNEAGFFGDKKIATTLEPLEAYYAGEEYHQDFAKANPTHGYILQQAAPKVKKVKEKFEGQVRGD